MTGALVLIPHDLRLQYRYGIYVAYAFVVGFYVTVLLLAGEVLPAWAIATVIYTDPAAVGFFFLGALMMLEKAEGVRTALSVTPVTATQYLLGKLLTLGGLAVLSATILLLVHARAANPALLLVTTALTAAAFLALGVPIAQRFRTVNAYLVGSAVWLTPIIGPAFLAFLDPMPLWLVLWPPVAQLRLLLAALGGVELGAIELTLSLVVATAAALGCLAFARADLKKELGK